METDPGLNFDPSEMPLTNDRDLDEEAHNANIGLDQIDCALSQQTEIPSVPNKNGSAKN